MKQREAKTYILKYDVYNNQDFPAGTIVKITDDYWGNGANDKNTGFTVTEGKLRGKKGCVADGLDGFLIDDTIQNRKVLLDFQTEIKKLEDTKKKLKKIWDDIPTSTPTPH